MRTDVRSRDEMLAEESTPEARAATEAAEKELLPGEILVAARSRGGA